MFAIKIQIENSQEHSHTNEKGKQTPKRKRSVAKDFQTIPMSYVKSLKFHFFAKNRFDSLRMFLRLSVHSYDYLSE